MVQHRSRPEEPAAHDQPRHQGAREARGDGGHLLQVDHQAGVLQGEVHRHPRGGQGEPGRAQPPFEPPARGAPGEVPEDPGEDLLQEGGHVAPGKPQGEHGARSGVLQRQGGNHHAHHRDRGRTVGNRSCHGIEPVRSGHNRVHGQGKLRTETLQKDHHEPVRRQGLRFAVGVHRLRKVRAQGASRDIRITGYRHLGGM